MSMPSLFILLLTTLKITIFVFFHLSHMMSVLEEPQTKLNTKGTALYRADAKNVACQRLYNAFPDVPPFRGSKQMSK